MSNKAHLTQVYSAQGNNRFLCMCSHDLQQHFNTSVSITASETLEHLKAVFTNDVLIPQKNRQFLYMPYKTHHTLHFEKI